MNAQTVELQLPEPLLRRFREAAADDDQPVELMLIHALQVNPPPPSLDTIPLPARDAVRSLRDLSDDELWRVAQYKLPRGQQQRLADLLDKNGLGTLTDDERDALDQLVEQADIQSVVKAYAYALLRWHGHPLPGVGQLDQSA